MLFPAIFAYFEKLDEISKEKRKDTMNTQEPFVITISREVGSGGHTEEELARFILSFCSSS